MSTPLRVGDSSVKDAAEARRPSPHVPLLGLAADLPLAATLPHTDLVEYIAGSPWVDTLATEPWALDAYGMLANPAGPGLGLD